MAEKVEYIGPDAELIQAVADLAQALADLIAWLGAPQYLLTSEDDPEAKWGGSE